MTKMTAMPIYGKNPVDRFQRNLAWSIDDSSTTMYILIMTRSQCIWMGKTFKKLFKLKVLQEMGSRTEY